MTAEQEKNPTAAVLGAGCRLAGELTLDNAVLLGRFEGVLRVAGLLEIGESLDNGVEQAWKAAQRGQQLTDARRRIDGPRLQRQLEGLDAADPRRSGLEAQLATHGRLAEREERTQSELETLDVRLDEAVARLTELGTRAGDVAELDEVAASIGNVVRELEALRLGLDDVEGAA